MKSFIERKKQSALAALASVYLLFLPVPLFAQLKFEKSENLVKEVANLFTSDIARFIMIACLAGCGIAYGFNKDNEKMKKSIIAIAIGIAIVVGATSIVGAIWDAS